MPEILTGLGADGWKTKVRKHEADEKKLLAVINKIGRRYASRLSLSELIA